MKQEFREGITIYSQIVSNIENAILEGELKPEERLSSLRESAVEMEVNINTIMRAYNLLEEEGILRKKRGLGFFVSEDALKIIQKKRREAFYQNTVPELSKTLERLGINVDDLIEALKKEGTS
ncbi:DNA-binding transcriptional regulator YhcF (GntR family) [Natranaerovirga pectinivora]|uniref:DNA-binding transcriptional regulator YhcF (GntR family) n=1 Tax=Natranaerovirga pectinivora TaxID=682400 RepID=A0A4R3MFB4_9FIRM|nr:GntR family transcriptional regulator [Natranaerovirga pectinivora]TCT12220.1 DNA-binding transcriptional regulator YhcF (GntR family) [Natranaerovirga pectinivora]